MEGFAEKPKVTKKVTFPSGSGAGGGVDGPRGAGGGEEREGGDMKEDQGQEAPEKKKAKMELLGAKTLQYAIVFKTVRCEVDALMVDDDKKHRFVNAYVRTHVLLYTAVLF